MARHPGPEDDTDEIPSRGPLGRADPTRSLSELFGHHEDDNVLPENVTRLSPFRRGDRQRDR
jgi:hypothetical protein